MAWNPDNKKYEPIVFGLELLSRKAVSEWIASTTLPIDFNLSVSQDEAAFTLPGTAVDVVMGVEFLESKINGEPYAQPHSGSMAVVGCYKE